MLFCKPYFGPAKWRTTDAACAAGGLIVSHRLADLLGAIQVDEPPVLTDANAIQRLDILRAEDKRTVIR